MMAQLDDNSVPPLAKSKEDAAENIPAAIAYLKRTDNLDLADQLGLSTYLEETDEQKTKDRSGPADGGE
jgi:hypothetical protein